MNPKVKNNLFWITLLIIAVIFMGRYAKTHQINITEVRAVYITPTPYIANPTSEQETIISYIKEIFGKDSDKAFKLLECENKSLNPNAINDNTIEGGIGQDIGIFQINNHWQGVQAKFLKNYKINIEIAHQLYEENNNSFRLWACSHRLGLD